MDPKSRRCTTWLSTVLSGPFITGDSKYEEDGQDVLDGMLPPTIVFEPREGYHRSRGEQTWRIENLNRLIQQNGLSIASEVFSYSQDTLKAERVLVYETTGKVMNAGVLPAQLGVILCVSTIPEFWDSTSELVCLSFEKNLRWWRCCCWAKNVFVQSEHASLM